MKGQKTVVRKFADPSIIDTESVLTQDEFLTNIVVGTRGNTYMMDAFLPEERVKKDSNKIEVISSKGYFKAASRRAETALPEQAAMQFDEDTYTTDEFALEGWVSDDAVRNAWVQTDPLARQADFLAKRIMLTQEIGIVSEIFAASKAAGGTHYDILGANENWNGGSSSDPLGNISTALVAIVNRTGVMPNLMSFSHEVYEAFIHNDQVLDILKNTTDASVVAAAPVNTIRGLRFQLANAVVNAGTLDTPTFRNIQYDVNTTTQMYDTVILAYTNKSDPLTLGHNFVSKPFVAYRGRGMIGDRRQATLVAVWKKFGPKVTNVGASHIIAKVLG